MHAPETNVFMDSRFYCSEIESGYTQSVQWKVKVFELDVT